MTRKNAGESDFGYSISPNLYTRRLVYAVPTRRLQLWWASSSLNSWLNLLWLAHCSSCIHLNKETKLLSVSWVLADALRKHQCESGASSWRVFFSLFCVCKEAPILCRDLWMSTIQSLYLGEVRRFAKVGYEDGQYSQLLNSTASRVNTNGHLLHPQFLSSEHLES